MQSLAKSRKPRIGLLIEPPSVTGGIQSAAERHVKILDKDFEIIPISFEASREEKDWSGYVDVAKFKAGASERETYRIVASDFRTDHRMSEHFSIENIRSDIRFRSYADHLQNIVREKEIDLLHAFGVFHQRSVIAAYVSAKTGVPFMLSFRGVDLETRVFDKMLYQIQAAIPSANSIVCVSEDSRKLVERLFQPKAPVFVARNHFDPSLFQDSPIKPPFTVEAGVPVIGSFGNFRRVTGFDFLLESFERLNKKQPAFLLLAGNIQRREAEYYNPLIDSLQSRARIFRIGYIPHPQVLSYMRLCDMLVFPSISDASPNKILEAMYAKVPIISTFAGGIPELVENGKEALLVPARTIDPLLAAMENILENPDLGECLAAAAYSRVTQKFSLAQERTLWQEIYAKSLGVVA